MTTDRWPRVKELFHAALALPADERPAYVHDRCAGDVELEADVTSLLESDARPDAGLSKIVAAHPGETSERERHVGRRVGLFHLVEPLGEGGMGVVYLAERTDDFHQRAAVKLIRSGMSSRLVVERFRHERRILAGLEHPNIARLLDGGATEDGQPYLVMEFVDGPPITTYADAHRLTRRDRLMLFRQVCAGVQHAHRHLVVHRDIKPANILVTAGGTAKLMDFGIAKLVTPDASDGSLAVALTQTGALPMTPEYASPEQVRGLSLTTATDVYSLGIVLYELLAGRRPYDVEAKTPAEVERVICEIEPPPPSAVASGNATSGLAGDLDTIVAKALAKDVARRYSSVEQLSADVQRHLDGIPIEARPQTFLYRASRFVRRNRAAAAAAALLVVSLAAGLGATLRQARIAQQERARADRRFNDVRALAHSFVFDFHDAIKDLPGATEARRLVVAKALVYLNTLALEAADDTALQQEVAEAYLRVGDVQGNPGGSNLGDIAGALESYRRALPIAQELSHRDSGNIEAQRLLVRAHEAIGTLLFIGGDPAAAMPHYRDMARATADLTTRLPKDAVVQMLLVTAYESLGDVTGHPGYPSLGDTTAASAAYRQARTAAEQLVADHPENLRGRRAVGVMDMKLGDVALGAGDVESAIATNTSAAAIVGAVSASDPLNPTTRLMVALITEQLGEAYGLAGQIEPALAQYEKARAVTQQLIDADPKNQQSSNSYALNLKATGDLLARAGKRVDAAAAYRESLAAMRRVIAAQSTALRRGRYAAILAALAGVTADDGRTEDARRMYREAFPGLKSNADRTGAGFDEVSVYAEQLLVSRLAEFRDPAAAVVYAKRAVALTHERAPKYLELLARVYAAAGQSAEAIATQERAISLLPSASPWRAISERSLASLKTQPVAPAAR
jgi:eukaryotic-like serine/threonine-protein kinase